MHNVPHSLDMTAFGKLGPSAEDCLQRLVDVACSAGADDRGLQLRIAKQFLRCALGWVEALLVVTTTRLLLHVPGKIVLMMCCALRKSLDACRPSGDCPRL